MIERLNMDSDYTAIESAIHVNRYLIAKDLCKGKKVLDIACGEGYGTHLLKKWGAEKVTGIDIDDEIIKKARKKFNDKDITFESYNAEKIGDFLKEKYDLIVSFETIEHLENPKLYLEELKKVSTSKATIIISCPNDYFYYPTEEVSNPYHKEKYNLNDFINLVTPILKKPDQVFLGFPVRGFINKDIKTISKNKDKQLSMIKNERINALELLPDLEINEKSASYFIAVWNGNIKNSSSIYSYPMGGDKEVEVYLKEIRHLNDYHQHYLYNQSISEEALIQEVEYLKSIIKDYENKFLAKTKVNIKKIKKKILRRNK